MTEEEFIRRKARVAAVLALVLLVFMVAAGTIFLVALVSIALGAAAVLGWVD